MYPLWTFNICGKFNSNPFDRFWIISAQPTHDFHQKWAVRLRAMSLAWLYIYCTLWFFTYGNMRTWRQASWACGLYCLVCSSASTVKHFQPLWRSGFVIWCIAQSPQEVCATVQAEEVYPCSTDLCLCWGHLARMFFSFHVCVINWVTFFPLHTISEKQTNWLCCYRWSAGCSSWINHRDEFGEREILLCCFSVVTYRCWGNLLSSLATIHWFSEFGRLASLCNKKTVTDVTAVPLADPEFMLRL